MTGLSAMIILIAVVLIAAATGMILLAHMTDLNTRSLKVSREVEKMTINGVEVVSIMASDGTVGSDLEHFEMVLRLKPGSDSIGLINNTLITITTPTTHQSLTYNHTLGNTNRNAATTSDYTVEWLKTDSAYEVGYLKRGDLIKIRFNHHDVLPTATAGGIGADTLMQIRIIPYFGTTTFIQFRTPHHINQQKEGLWPKESKR